jgi:pimeloyl-ACP methyl ester carboxylesterase
MKNMDSERSPIGQHTGTTIPNRDNSCARNVAIEARFPCTTILIHGVNDLGTDFCHVENGLCAGLNDRLNRTDLKAGTYTQGRTATNEKRLTTKDLLKSLDEVIYRRQEPQGTKSVLIPFYWGYKASGADLPKSTAEQTKNGQVVDKFGNRLDKNRAKNGGMFANATTNIPDMFNSHFKGGFVTGVLDRVQADPTHPLREAPNRHYMVLAAKRLAALVRQIRLLDPNETVNIVAHSQGTIISLLAQVFLSEGGGPADRPADTLVLIDSPYGLEQREMDQALQRHGDLQTTYARVKTLVNLVNLVSKAKHSDPPLNALKVDLCGTDNHGVTGPLWDPSQARKAPGGVITAFAERDNRGKVYVYFSPEDATVGLESVYGMGSVGLPDSAKVFSAKPNAAAETIKIAQPTLLQRVFTRRKRNGKPVFVGAKPGPYNLREEGESSHGSTGVTAWFKQGSIPVDTIRTINAEALQPPFAPEMEANVLPGTSGKPLRGPAREDVYRQILNKRIPAPAPGAPAPTVASQTAAENAGKAADDQVQVLDISGHSNLVDIFGGSYTETYKQSYNQARAAAMGGVPDNETQAGTQTLDQVEAEIALSATELQPKPLESMAWPNATQTPSAADVEKRLNQGKDTDDQCQVTAVLNTFPPDPGNVWYYRTETPNEAKVRLMNDTRSPSSYHSAVMSGEKNHRYATAMDVSVGQARALDDKDWARLLRGIADWRISAQDNEDYVSRLKKRNISLDSATVRIVNANYEYYKSGTFPSPEIVPISPPAPVVSETMHQVVESMKSQQAMQPFSGGVF